MGYYYYTALVNDMQSYVKRRRMPSQLRKLCQLFNDNFSFLKLPPETFLNCKWTKSLLW